ncbi:LECRK53 [Symbiodinium natans]|uniref:LECRK53 protein n=1 Tax=Symbiodinium natans TaxID=878477 RepID=A0A812QMH0_9DINO|nr:LECRK53 [Symbiodinium natans]
MASSDDSIEGMGTGSEDGEGSISLPDTGPSFQVRVSTMDSLLCTVTAYGEWSSHTLKKAVQANSAWSEHRQRLFYGTQELCEVLLQANGRLDKLSDLLNHPCEGAVISITAVSRTRAQEEFLEALAGTLGGGDVSELIQHAEVRGDRYCMLAVVAWFYNYPDLEFASEELKTDREFILQCVTIYASCLWCIGQHLVGDRAFMEEAIRRSPFALTYASDDLKGDEALVRLAVSSSPNALVGAAPRFKDMKELVLPCVTADGYSLRDMSDRMRADREVVLAALCNQPTALEFASLALKADTSVVDFALSHCVMQWQRHKVQQEAAAARA